ncbi:Imm21 family immunity protein [Nonomuraea sp. GTA35]|uniref:Imm21 family immunity protein n=1 Tax=Nonomuraea sp. GTA35 TaxID=1676746 RepID=UPI0035C119BB
MIWVESAGGPLAVISEAALKDWSGFEGDYERACDVEFVGVIPVGQSNAALILGDEPAGTTYVPVFQAFVQWLWGEPGADVLVSLERGLPDATWEAGPIFDVAGQLVIFDAAQPGSQVVIDNADRSSLEPTIYQRTENALRVELSPNSYRVESADISSDAASCFRVHRLVAVPLGDR